jgi:thioesterase domain-containing protein
MKYWNPWINELKEQLYCNHIVLEKNQYLQDVL